MCCPVELDQPRRRDARRQLLGGTDEVVEVLQPRHYGRRHRDPGQIHLAILGLHIARRELHGEGVALHLSHQGHGRLIGVSAQPRTNVELGRPGDILGIQQRVLLGDEVLDVSRRLYEVSGGAQQHEPVHPFRRGRGDL